MVKKRFVRSIRKEALRFSRRRRNWALNRGPRDHRALATSFGYLVILAVGAMAVWFCWEKSEFEYNAAKQSFRTEAEHQARDTAKTAASAITQIYQNIRTISLLPSVQDIDRHGTTLDDNARLSIQQIYNNIASNVAVSAVYIAPADFDPKRTPNRIDPVTGKLEAPILLFDELIVVKPRNVKADRIDKSDNPEENEAAEEVEIYQYHQMREQIAWLRARYPNSNTFSGLKVPFLNGSEVITGDNSVFNKTRSDIDRMGIIFSVPFYGRDGGFKGVISAIMLSNALSNVLRGDGFALVDTRQGYIAAHPGDPQVSASLDFIAEGIADPRLIASAAIKLPLESTQTQNDWHLWMGHPDSDFLTMPETRARITQRNFSIAACLIIMTMALAFWRVFNRTRVAELAQWRDLSEATLEGLLICDGDTITTSNGRFLSILGVNDRVLKGMRLEQIIVDPGCRAKLRSGQKHYVETTLRSPAGAEIPVEILARSIAYMGRQHRVLAVRDQSDLHEAEKKLRFLALRDPLTELANRNRFLDALQNALKHAGPSRRFAILCLDLDGFKHVNDTLGHAVGDQLLRAVAVRLAGGVREPDLVARMGGDEFAILQPEHDQPEAATALASRLIEDIGDPFVIESHHITIGTSVGIAIAPDDSHDPATLLKNADLALYRAKSEGKGTYRLFEAGMDAKMQTRRLLELELRKALDLDQFELFYQPIVQAHTRSICGFEALLRWRHPTRGLVPPLDFVPLAEEIGLMGKIGAWVLKQACSDAMTWPETIRVAVNVSPAQFRRRSLELDVMAALGASGMAADRLEIEITESVLLDETDASLATLERLRARGVRIAMDDFGTGYSSLSYLQKFPFDKIKIDKSFVSGSGSDNNGRAIIQAILGLAASFGMSTTAEGIETEEQLRNLSASGCAEFQGYLFSRPMSGNAVGDFLKLSEDGVRRAV